MGVNRIVMHNGVVWWLLPPRKRRHAAGGAASRRPAEGPPAEHPPADAGTCPPRDHAALPPAGFIPLSALGLPGIDAILGGHAELYRQAYDSAMREIEESRGRTGDDHRPAGPPPADAAE